MVGGLTHSFVLGVIMLVLSGIGGAIFNTTNQTVVQLIAPAHLRGRITGVLQVQPLCMALGMFATGAASDAFGAVAVGAANGAIAFAFGLLILALSPRMRQLRLSTLMDASEPAGPPTVAVDAANR